MHLTWQLSTQNNTIFRRTFLSYGTSEGGRVVSRIFLSSLKIFPHKKSYSRPKIGHKLGGRLVVGIYFYIVCTLVLYPQTLETFIIRQPLIEYGDKIVFSSLCRIVANIHFQDEFVCPSQGFSITFPLHVYVYHFYLSILHQCLMFFF